MSIFYIDLDYESKERYDTAKFLEFNIDNFDCLTSYFLEEVSKLKITGRYVVQKHAYKPYNISYEIYGSTQYWWILMFYNNIYDVKQLTSETILYLFDITDLETLYFKLKSQEVLSKNDQAIGSTTVSIVNQDKNLIVPQVILSDTWVINHNLKKQPSVTVVIKNINGDEQVINTGLNIIYPNGLEDKQVIITFTTPQRGKVILN